jgi:hypothetical protein
VVRHPGEELASEEAAGVNIPNYCFLSIRWCRAPASDKANGSNNGDVELPQCSE